jgi:two-component system NtrC family sensor kinase
MSVSAKVMLFALAAIGATALMGGALYRLASQGPSPLRQILAAQEEGQRYASLKSDAWDFVDALRLVHRSHGDTQAVLARYEQRSHENFERIRELWAIAEERSGSAASSLHKELLDQLQSEHQQWLKASTALVSEATARPEEPLPQVLLDRFTLGVDPLLQKLWAAQRNRSEELELARLRELQLGERIGLIGPLLSLVAVLAVLAMAATIAKERLVRAEAAASEHEVRRCNTLLEETVRTRTAELASSNAQLKESLHRLRAIQEQLRFSERLAAIGQAAGCIGHEINNPLAFLISNLTFSQEELERTKGALSAEEYQEVREALAEASDGAERIRLIVNDLKMLLHPGTIERCSMDLTCAIRAAVKMAAHEIRHRTRLVEELDGIPPVHGNSARLTQVFLNLLINAAHAIPLGQAERNEIRINAQVSAPDHVIVKVSDTGSGIPPEHVKRIFDPFFTTKPVGMGSGLGLSVCHSIIAAHGGEISVESDVGRGTTFQIVLPLARQADGGQHGAQGI